jgi:orotate phosphoribosyltransferase
VVEVLRNGGIEVIGMASIFTYGFPVAENAFTSAGVTNFPLTNYASLIELAVSKGNVSGSEQEILLKWRDDPANWKGVL